MTIELDSGVTASPEDLYGPKTRSSLFGGIDFFPGNPTLFKVADGIDELRPLASSMGRRLVDFYGSFFLEEEGQTMDECEIQFLVDSFDEIVWVHESQIEKFRELFGTLVKDEGNNK